MRFFYINDNFILHNLPEWLVVLKRRLLIVNTKYNTNISKSNLTIRLTQLNRLKPQ